MTDIRSHVTSITIDAPADRVFGFISDPARLDRWSFGTWTTRLHEGGLVEGRAIFDKAVAWVRIDADPKRLLVDYHLGADKDHLVPRISARVLPGGQVDLDRTRSVLTLVAWRPASMDDARWRRLTASHEFEVVLLKSLIERDGRDPDAVD